MKQRILLTIIGFLIFNLSFGQENEKYSELINEAWKLYETREYLKSAEKYSEAFVALNNKGKSSDRYNAACSWAMANKIDSAFVQLFKIVKYDNYINYNHISTDTDLTTLYSDKRWSEIIEFVKANKEKVEANYNKLLVSVLDTIYNDDQKYRAEGEELINKYGWESEEVKDFRKIIIAKDSINLIKVEKILTEYGWLGTDIVGEKGNSTLFLVIQHAKTETQLKYLPMFRVAVNNGKAQASHLALMEDRVLLAQGEKQIYGSQIGTDMITNEYILSPMIDPDNVDKRIEEIGLMPLAEYLNHFDLVWDIEKFKKRMKEYDLTRTKK